jgi:sugar phosphate permease
MNFHCSWDTNVTLITLLFAAILLGVVVMLYFIQRRYSKEKRMLQVCIFLLGILFCIGVLIFSALECPFKVSVEKGNISIHRMIGNIIIPVQTIEEIRLCNYFDTEASVRTFGSGGAFGYLGKFRNTQLGDYQMYITDSSKKILVKTKDETFVFSCDKPEELIRAVEALHLP